MLLAITQFGSWVGLSAFAGSLCLIGHAVFARAPRDQSKAIQSSVLTIVFGVPLVFCGIWVWLWPGLWLLAWAAWIGDNEHWFYDWSRSIAAFLAAGVTLIFTLRVLARRARESYAKVQCAGAGILLLLFGLVAFEEFVGQAEGTDPEIAARRVLRKQYPFVTASELREENRTPSCVTYVASDGKEPKARITVCRYRRWWWEVGATQLLVPHPNVWQSIEDAQQRHPEHAKRLLRDVIKHYPDSEASHKAERLLRQLSETSTAEPEDTGVTPGS